MTKQQVKSLQAKLKTEVEKILSLPTDEYVDYIEMNSALWAELRKHGSVTTFGVPMDDGCVGMLHIDEVISVFINEQLTGTNVVLVTKDA